MKNRTKSRTRILTLIAVDIIQDEYDLHPSNIGVEETPLQTATMSYSDQYGNIHIYENQINQN